jgi:MFS family permease
MTKTIDKNIHIALLLVATLGIMSGMTIVSSLPLISHTFSDIPNIEFLSKLMLTIPAIIIALFSPFAGHIVDRFGRLRPLYIGIFLFVIGGSSGFYLNDFYSILAGRAVLGFGVSLVMTSSTALIGDYFSAEARHAFMSKQGMVIALGGILFISIGGILAQMDWTYPFAVYLIPVLFVPFLLRSLYEPEQHKQQSTSEVAPRLLPVYVTAFFVMVLFYMLPTQFPYLIVNTLGGEPRTVGFVIAMALVFNAVTSMQYAKIKAKYTFLQIYVMTFVLFAIGLFFISLASSIAGLFLSVAPIGMGFGLLFVNTNAWFLSLVPAHKRGQASGILTSSFFLGQFFSPIFFEPIVSAYGLQSLFLIVSVVAMMVAVVLFVKSRRL